MALISLYNQTTTGTTEEQRRHQHQQRQQQQQQHRSSSAFIAHLLVQEYPPKVQPRSSSARDKALFSHLDKVDAEAGCILIALANHDKRKDMNDLIPYSIRVIDYDQTKPMGTRGDSAEATNGENSSSDSSCSDSSISDDAICDAGDDDPTATSTASEGDSNGTMSIKNLIDANNESSTSDTPALSENTKSSQSTGQQPSLSPSTSSVSLSSVPATRTPSSSISLTTQHNDDNDQSKAKSLSKSDPRTDPILLLAAAAKVIDQDEHLIHQGANQKRKYSNDDSSDLESRSHSAQRPRHAMGSQTLLDQSHQWKFSHQYLSMKQNPKIMRNAMHAYISYMIYADLASSDKMPYHRDQGTTSSNTSYPTHSSSPHLHYTTSDSYPTFSRSSPPTSDYHHHHHPQPHANHYDHSSSRTDDPTLPTNPPPINLGPLNNSIAGNSSIMARPLTAFLRENMYT